MARITVVYYSATGNVHGLAEALAEGAESVGAEVRLRRVQETAPDAAIASNDAWQSYVTEVAPTVEVVSLEDLQWADGFGFGAPTRFGNPAGQLRNFLDTTGGLWHQGVLDGKAVTSFTSASTPRRPRVDDLGAQQHLLSLGRSHCARRLCRRRAWRFGDSVRRFDRRQR